MKQTSRTRRTTRLAPLIAVVGVWFLVTACGGEDEVGAAQSEDSLGGDLAALQYKQAQLICGCPEDAKDLCLAIAWPEGKTECHRSVYNARIDSNGPAYDCAMRVVEDSIACWQEAGCDGLARERCADAFADETMQCPQFDTQTQAEGQACVFGEKD